MLDKDPPKPNCVDHLANERTFLAWVRTAVGIMAFGFVVEKFTLFMRQITFFFTKEGTTPMPLPHTGYSSIFGIILVAFGAIMGLLAYIKFKRDEAHIDKNTFKSSSALALLLTVAICVIGIFLAIYLL